MSKKKLAIILIMIVCAVGVLFACGDSMNQEDIAVSNGYTVKITIDLNGGTSSYNDMRYVRVKPNSPLIFPWNVPDSKISAPTNAGFNLEGLYTGTVDEEGNITFIEKFTEGTPVNEDLTLYARWVRRFSYKIIDIETGAEVEEIYCAKGATFGLDPKASSDYLRRSGYTLINYYSRNEINDDYLWDGGFTHPGLAEGLDYDNSEDEDYVVNVYGHYVEGSYTKVYEAADLTKSATSLYLMGDGNKEIDCSSLSDSDVAHLYLFENLIGNGVTIKNLTVTREDVTQFGDVKGIGLFARTMSGATVTDVTFKDCTVNIVYKTNRLNIVGVVNMGFICGAATDTTVKNVAFDNCSLNISIVRKNGDPTQYVAIAEYEDGASQNAALWANRDDDEANGNKVENVSGDITVTFTDLG